MIVRISVLLLSASISLIGCAGGNRSWVKNDVPRSETEQALAECRYQAEAATVTIGAGGHYKSYESAIGSGIAAGVEQAMDQQKLIEDCMKAKGFNQ